MYRNRTIAAVVPAYKEEALIGTVITTMPLATRDEVVTPIRSAYAAAAVGARCAHIRRSRTAPLARWGRRRRSRGRRTLGITATTADP